MPPDGIFAQVSHEAASPTLVFVHGALDRGATFKQVVPWLSDVRVVCYDRRGYGRSVDAAPVTGMQDHAQDLLDIIEEQPGPVVVVACSWGGLPAMLAATQRPEAFAALGIWETALMVEDWWPQEPKQLMADIKAAPDPATYAEQMTRTILGEEAWNALDDERRARRLAEGRTHQVDMGEQLERHFAFADVTVPTVVGYGSETFEDRKVGCPWLADRLPDAQLFVAPGADHFAQRTKPAAFVEFVRAVLGRLRPVD